MLVNQILLALIMTLTCIDANASDWWSVQQKINEHTARILVTEAYYGSAKPTDSFDYDGEEVDKNQPFFGYGGIAPNTEGSFGSFAVNKWTGDVWDLWECKIISTPASLRLQLKIRKRFTADEEKKYDQLAAIKPGCLND